MDICTLSTFRNSDIRGKTVWRCEYKKLSTSTRTAIIRKPESRIFSAPRKRDKKRRGRHWFYFKCMSFFFFCVVCLCGSPSLCLLFVYKSSQAYTTTLKYIRRFVPNMFKYCCTIFHIISGCFKGKPKWFWLGKCK